MHFICKLCNGKLLSIEKTASRALGEAAKMHKVIRQIVFQTFRTCLNQTVGTFAD